MHLTPGASPVTGRFPPPNTCRASCLVVGDLAVSRQKEFTTIAVTAHHWVSSETFEIEHYQQSGPAPHANHQPESPGAPGVAADP